MLNRRILRIKAMQALYGFYTTRESLKLVYRDHVEQRFTPDPLIHDLSDTEELDRNRKIATRLFSDNLAHGKVESNEEISNEVLNVVNQAILDYYSEIKAEVSRVKKSMLADTKQLQTDYLKLLLLPAEFQFIEKLDKEKKESAHVTQVVDWHFNLLTNPVVEALTTHPPLQQAATHHQLSWQAETDRLKSWYKTIIKTDERFVEYQKSKSPGIEGHLALLKHLYKNLIFKNETITDFFESENIRWSEDGPILKSMVIKTIQECGSENPLELKTISINEEDDFEFFETIYSQAIKEDDYLEGLISEKTKNWDVSRLARMDRIILKMALAEMMHCRSIPTKVSINEYIEICKLYSTPKSKQFVNGILDVLANQLTSEGVIRKSGRGLIDNR